MQLFLKIWIRFAFQQESHDAKYVIAYAAEKINK